MNKKLLYESIIENIAKDLKETLKRDEHDILKWRKQNNPILISNSMLQEIQLLIKFYMNDRQCPKKLFERFDKDTLIDLGGYILEADLYTATIDAVKEVLNLHQEILDEYHLDIDDIKVTKRAGRGLHDIDKNGIKIPIYWDFSIFGIKEKFEIKTKCLNGYHLGGISYTKNQNENKDFILIYCEYEVDENEHTYDIKNITIKRVK